MVTRPNLSLRRVPALVVCIAAAITCRGREPVAPSDDPLLAAGKNGLAAPSGAVAQAVSSRRIDLAWKDNATAESGFEIHGSSTGSAGPFTLYTATPANTMAFSLTYLEPATSYCFKVRAFSLTVRGKQTNSSFSNTSCATTSPPTPPSPPTDLNARPVPPNVILLSWKNNATDAFVIGIERSATAEGPWTTIASLTPDRTSYGETHSGEELSVCYRVRVHNPDGTSTSTADCTTPPRGPHSLTATANAGGTVALGWTDNSSVEDGFSVERHAGDGVWTVVATVGPNVVSHVDTPPLANVVYTYQVSASKDGGSSSPSHPVSVVVATMPPSAPTGLSVMVAWGYSAELIWSYPEGLASAFRVERSIDGRSTWTTVHGTYYTEGSPWVYGDEFLALEIETCYRVIAINSGGESPPSEVKCFVAPAGPSDLQATITGGDVELRWTDNSSVEDGFEVWIITPATEWAISTLPANSTSVILSRPGPGFGYLIFAVKGGNLSAPVGWHDEFLTAEPRGYSSDASTLLTPPPHHSARAPQ